MGWMVEEWSISVTLDAHAGPTEAEHDRLWEELRRRLNEVAQDPKYNAISPAVRYID